MIELSNAALGRRWLCCYNPSLVEIRGKTFLFYRFTPDRSLIYTRIAFVELDSGFRSVCSPQQVQLPPVSDRIVSFEDPRAFVWRDNLWLMHVQAALDPELGWSACTVLARLGADGEVVSLDVPNVGRNHNLACADAPPAIDRNWTPAVVGDDLYLIYELNPLTVFRLSQSGVWEQVCRQDPWISGWTTYLSGGTPLVPWKGSEYLAAFHTYNMKARSQRVYSMGFCSVNVSSWRVVRVSSAPVLTAASSRFWDTRPGVLRRLLRGPRSTGESLVVFPSGLLRQGERWAVSFGWNDCRSRIELYDDDAVERTLQPVTGADTRNAI